MCTVESVHNITEVNSVKSYGLSHLKTFMSKKKSLKLQIARHIPQIALQDMQTFKNQANENKKSPHQC